MASETADALESVLSHPGWRVFLDHCHREWGPNGAQYQAELDKALDLTDSVAAASQARQIRAARRMVEMLLAWPAEEVKRLRRADEQPEPTYSRRGGL